jgi:hypothetical protein
MSARWKLVRGAGYVGRPVGYLKPQYHRFRWTARLGAWVWLNANFFWGALTADVVDTRAQSKDGAI